MIEVKMNSMDGVVLMTAGKKVEENIKVTPHASLISPEYNGEYDLLVPTVSGVWVFGEGQPYDEKRIEQSVNFVCDGVNCNLIFTNSGLCYEPISTEIDNPVYDTSWSEDAYRTIDFGTEPQEVSEEFYTWLTANAVKQ